MIEIEQAKLAPDFTMTSADGRPIRLGDFPRQETCGSGVQSWIFLTLLP
jgi:hypothetical protein